MHTLVLYDVASDRLRNKVAQACIDYGLLRVQYSAFLGDLNANRRAELCSRFRRLLGTGDAEVRIVCLCDKDVKLMQTVGMRHGLEADGVDERRPKGRRRSTTTRAVKRIRRGEFIFASTSEADAPTGGTGRVPQS